jgi:hypothetical protein
MKIHRGRGGRKGGRGIVRFTGLIPMKLNKFSKS